MIVVGGGNLHNPPEVLAHLGWGARVGLVPDPQLAVAIVQEAEGSGDFPRRGLVGRGPRPDMPASVVR